MSRDDAVARIRDHFDTGGFKARLAEMVAHRTESQRPDRGPELRAYLTDCIGPWITGMGFGWRIVENSLPGRPPFLIGDRHEGDGLPTVFIYGHGDVIHGYDDQWSNGRSPWAITVEGDRWYGRGVADNKGQHAINLTAVETVLKVRGRLGFNVKLLIDMGEESGSPGLDACAAGHRDALKADVLIASDGPRLHPDRPMLYLGTRGVLNFRLEVDLRAGGHHSGNWGGLLANPGTILANAIASIVDGNGVIKVKALRPPPAPESVRAAILGLRPDGGPDGPTIDDGWGEPGLTPSERVYGWNAIEVLAFKTGNPEKPANAIPPHASAMMQIRYVVGTDWENIVRHVQEHLDAHGFAMVKASAARDEAMAATRLDPGNPWVTLVAGSIGRTTGTPPQVLPNLGGTLPNAVFAHTLGLPTVWIPHSYAGCNQHAPDEHGLAPVLRQGLEMMAGVYWDVGEAR